MTTNYDSLAIGYRATDGTSKPGWTNDINSVTVVAGLAAQAGPYFFVTSSGDPCSGGMDIGLSGSVTTNVYWLYTNGVTSGQSVLGTGSAIDFGPQSVPADYTVMASNTDTFSTGPMYGSADVYEPGIAVNTEPSSVALVTNLPTSFTVDATGAALSYQWYKNGVALTNNANITGAQTPTLSFASAGAGDAATSLNGYTVVVQDPCGDIVTSTPPAALTLVSPNNLVWQGNDQSGTWDLATTLNFLNPSSANEAFTNGDIVTFNDTLPNTSVTISNNLIPTLTQVVGTQSYTFGGSGQLTGFGQLVDGNTGTLTIANKNSYTGGTVVSNGATLQLGTGSGIVGSVGGTVTVNAGGTLQYNYQGPGNATPVNLNETLAGSGTVNYEDQAGSILATSLNAISSNFNGTINIQGYTCLHASDGNAGYALGNGSTVNAPDGTQIWMDRSTTAYNSTFNIGGTGWLGANPQTGAMRVYANTINGNINPDFPYSLPKTMLLTQPGVAGTKR